MTFKSLKTKAILIAIILSILSQAHVHSQGSGKELKFPTAKRSDIQVEHVMEVSSKAVRLLKNPVTGNLWYTTFDGSVFEIKDIDGNSPAAEEVFNAEDHGITRLQGAVFLHNMLFLCGNISVNNNKGTKGRMVRFDINSSGNHEMTEVFNTVEYGTNKTTFDHGWNALEISPDEKFIYVNTGARTDHGEVQDNDGEYPQARDNALTAKIFKFPIDAENLLLANDESELKEKGYIYAEGIRNAYDMAFDADGNLFAVSNSGDYDHPEDMFWVREGHHYGFPWIMGGVENPQQYPDYEPNPETDPFLNPFAHAWMVKYFHNDPDFPKKPEGVKFTTGVQNLGPDANEYRGPATGKVVDGDLTRVAVSTFTAHSSPLGILFDTDKNLSDDFRRDGFVIRYGGGPRSSLSKPFTTQGKDLLHLDLTYHKGAGNYTVKTKSIVDGFTSPTDAVLTNNNIYIIEYGGRTGGNLWKITLP